MALVDLIDTSKKFGEKTILNETNFSANEGRKIAIIGKNGEGESSLLKALLGILALDGGRAVRQNGKSITMLSQTINFNANLSVKEIIKIESEEIYNTLKEYEASQGELKKEPINKEYLKRMDDLTTLTDSKNTWSIEAKITHVLKEFSLLDYSDHLACTLSGGEIHRVGLCILLLENPDTLSLDEPINRLDVYMTGFLEDLLKNSKVCVIFTSHDRYFIDVVVYKCIEVDQGKLSMSRGGYTNYLEKRTQILESLTKSHETFLKHLKSEEGWLRRGVRTRLKRNEGRKECIFKIREETKKNPGAIKRPKLEISRAALNFTGEKIPSCEKVLFELKNVSKNLGERALFIDFLGHILQGEHIAIVDKNGCGKSTFLKMLLGELKQDGGEIRRGEIKIGYFDQTRSLVNSDKTLLEIFCPNGGDRVEVRGKSMHVYGYLKDFLSPKKFLDKSVSILSGGEKSRVALALFFIEEYDVLILDESTNDLDIATTSILEEYLLNSEGAILLVSRDRYFVDKIVTKLYAFENGARIDILHTPYTEYLENEKGMQEFDGYVSSLDLQEQTRMQKKKSGKKLSYRENKILENHPERIGMLEKQISRLNSDLSNPSVYQEIGTNTLHEELEQAQKKLEEVGSEYFEVLERSENL